MTLTTSTGRNINIHFVHSSHDFKTREGAGIQRQELDKDALAFGTAQGLRDTRPRRLTLCELSEVVGEKEFNVLGQGIGVCHPNDTFKKPVGRKAALTAAMQAAGMDATERGSIWNAYLTQFGVKKA